jgi:hypothetical protein
MPKQLVELPPNPDMDPWVTQVNALGDLQRRKVFRGLVTDKRLSRFLYKYRSMIRVDPALNNGSEFHPRSVENLHDIMVRSLLRLSSPAQFNDPFDLEAYMYVQGTPEQRRARFVNYLRNNGVAENELGAQVDQYMGVSDEELVKVLRASQETHRNTVGVLCFADDPRSILMWSHYATHAGVCLQFDRLADLATLINATPVNYKPDYPTVNWLNGFEDGLLRMLLRKHPSWSYEGETRIIVTEQAGRYLPFQPGALRSIILGCRADDKVEERVDALLTERQQAGLPPVQKWRAVQHDKQYKLMLRRIS